MTAGEIMEAMARCLAARRVSFNPDSRLVEDLRLDSHDLVGIILEFETLLGRELDDDVFLLFVESSVGEICARLAQLSSCADPEPGSRE